MTCSPEHNANRQTLAEDLADVLSDAGCTAEAATRLSPEGWRMADELVRLRRGRPNRQPWLVPGEGTRQATIVLLLSRERSGSRPEPRRLASVPRTT